MNKKFPSLIVKIFILEQEIEENKSMIHGCNHAHIHYQLTF